MRDLARKPRPLDVRGWAVDRTSPLPLYVQIRQRLLSLIARWSRGEERFYSDEELCRHFGVSRVTVRQAVAELVEEGFLTRIRGAGTFVALKKIEEKLTPVMDIRSQWAALGRPMSVQVLAFERQPASAPATAVLDLPAGAEVFYIKRVRSTASVPIAVDHRYLPVGLAPSFRRADASGSLLHKLWQTCELSHSELQIEASLAGPEEEAVLLMPKGDPVLVRHLVYFDTEGRRVLAGHSIHRADLMRYSLRVSLSRESAGTSRAGADGSDGTMQMHEELRTQSVRMRPTRAV